MSTERDVPVTASINKSAKRGPEEDEGAKFNKKRKIK